MKLAYAEYRKAWSRMTTDEKDRVRDKAAWEHMGLWAVMQEWPSMIPRRLRPSSPQGLTG